MDELDLRVVKEAFHRGVVIARHIVVGIDRSAIGRPVEASSPRPGSPSRTALLDDDLFTDAAGNASRDSSLPAYRAAIYSFFLAK